jgi:hypothetical protein
VIEARGNRGEAQSSIYRHRNQTAVTDIRAQFTVDVSTPAVGNARSGKAAGELAAGSHTGEGE